MFSFSLLFFLKVTFLSPVTSVFYVLVWIGISKPEIVTSAFSVLNPARENFLRPWLELS